MSQHLIDAERRMAPGAPGSGHGNGAEGNGPALRRIDTERADERADPGREPVSSVNGTSGAEGPTRAAGQGGDEGDATVRALDALSGALDEMAKDYDLLRQRLDALRRERTQGRPWRDILADEEPPGTMQVVSRMLACLAKASGTLRKELVETLRSEGVTIPAIARLFGVTHQRVSNLLRRPSE